MQPRSTDYIVLDCSATPPTLDIGTTEIRQWHRAEGWSDIGYHFVIRRNGELEEGRPENLIGSHVQGHNSNSLGICLVGGVDARQRTQDNYTPEQWASLQMLLMRWGRNTRAPRCLGHRVLPGVAKACPCFDAIKWARANGFRAALPLRPVTASMSRAVRKGADDGDEAEDALAAPGTGAQPARPHAEPGDGHLRYTSGHRL